MGVRSKKLKRALEEDVIDFAENTSAHGIPRAYVSLGLRRALWLLLFLVCFCAFGYQAFLIIVRFRRNDIIVGVEIKFEKIKFPAVTVCNMNPYKNSAARQLPSIKNALEAFESAIDKSEPDLQLHIRTRRRTPSSDDTVYAEVVKCDDSDQIDFFKERPRGRKLCICSSFPGQRVFWNCRPVVEWTTSVCGLEKFANASEVDYLPLCSCIGKRCHPYIQSAQLHWPLEAQVQDETQLCIATENSTGPALCAQPAAFQLSPCNHCNWYSRCESSAAGEHSSQCLCENRTSSCFAVQTQPVRGQRTRLRRTNSRVSEHVLSHYDGLLAVYSNCICDKQDCVAKKEKPGTVVGNSTCLCFYNKKNDQVWPCYLPSNWKESKCDKCNTLGDCTHTGSRKAKIPCLCALSIHMCVRIDAPEGNFTQLEERVVKFWDIMPTTTMSAVVKKKEERDKAYGYSGVKDRIALRAKAMENIIFAVNELTEEEKWRISYNKSDFILKCSFNGMECHVKENFEEYLDPTYGACFTYAASRMDNMTNERAGPAYGLRLEIFANVTEYLPTTEAAGVRLTVHAHDEQPFPDTLGFSAPTGFVSSFGIKLKSITRLPYPHGDCVEEGKNEDFIYVDKAYSTEGCQRSCIQKHLANTCGCGDPRFPPFQKSKNCPVDDPYKRECIKKEMMVAARDSKKIGCFCRQPCNQDVYSVTYSASRWPAVAGDLSGCPAGMSANYCMMYKREQSAMIEVYFEQLNYESLLESEAYGWPNLLSDFGGQLGLWMGVSVITIMEVLILLLDLLLSLTGLKKRSAKRPSHKSFSSSLRYSFTRSNDIIKDGQ